MLNQNKSLRNDVGVRFEGYICGHLKMAGIKQKELADKLHMTPETLRKRIRNPWLLTVEDITKTASVLSVPIDSLFALSVGKELPAGSIFM